jgi:hypothetical protein
MVAALRQVASEMYDYRYGHSLYASPQLLAEWQFDESAGSISGAVDTVAGATWNDDPDWTLNGSGQAEFSGLVDTQYANQFTPSAEPFLCASTSLRGILIPISSYEWALVLIVLTSTYGCVPEHPIRSLI